MSNIDHLCFQVTSPLGDSSPNSEFSETESHQLSLTTGSIADATNCGPSCMFSWWVYWGSGSQLSWPLSVLIHWSYVILVVKYFNCHPCMTLSIVCVCVLLCIEVSHQGLLQWERGIMVSSDLNFLNVDAIAMRTREIWKPGWGYWECSVDAELFSHIPHLAAGLTQASHTVFGSLPTDPVS